MPKKEKKELRKIIDGLCQNGSRLRPLLDDAEMNELPQHPKLEKGASLLRDAIECLRDVSFMGKD